MYIEVNGATVDLVLSEKETQDLIVLLQDNLNDIKQNPTAGQARNTKALVNIMSVSNITNCGYLTITTDID